MTTYSFQKAQPVWAANTEKDMNCELAFRMVVSSVFNETAKLCLAASTIYRVFINGMFVAAGPARVAHGFYRVDELDVTKYLSNEKNVIVIEVVGYNVNTFDTLDQPSFLTAELLYDGVPKCYTGDNQIKIYDLEQRIRKVQRYSFQRAFVDCYAYSYQKRIFYTELQDDIEWDKLGIACKVPCIQGEKQYITRDVELPQFETLELAERVEIGDADFDYICPNPIRDRSYVNIGPSLKGFPPSELKEHLSEEGQNIAWIAYDENDEKQQEMFPLELHDGYGLYAFPYNATGFLRLRVSCKSPCSVYVFFDEILEEGKLNFLRLETCNCFKYMLDAGKHEIVTFASYVMKYVKVVAKGCCEVLHMDMIEYKHTPVLYQPAIPLLDGKEDATLKLIYEAALETYLANSLDVYMDCPSRERAGWLCDSFFTARVEYVLTGGSNIEKAFLDNYIMAEEFSHIPKGMLPMCYPADHYSGMFIPNWAMWFVLELEEYEKRTGDRDLIERAKVRVYELVQYFEQFENEYGLLENLEGWIFVEWSRANDADVVQDVNFPSNMIYLKMLQVVSELYCDKRLFKKAMRLREVIRMRSFRDGFYTDNEKRTEEGLVNPGNCTEVCQYYAFFTGVATKAEDEELWNTLVRDFGPTRKETNLHPQVAFANAFIGNYLRIELLYRDERYEEVLDNIRGYFAGMAKRTGTLWEHDSPKASCNHGFASHIIYWLDGIQKKERN